MSRGAKMQHGHAKAADTSSTYNIWVNMRQRCENANHRDFCRYGGRGIHVDARWNSFSGFLEDMGERPEGLSLDRIDNDGAYSKDNCRWATRDQQNLNKRTTSILTYCGVSKPLMSWATEFNLNHQLLRDRIVKLGWSVERTLNTPARKMTKANV